MKNKTNIFNVLIVYSAKIASSANSVDTINTPFKKGSNNESYNEVYSYFLESCKNKKIKCAFTTSGDIVGPGKCKSYWTFKNKVWVKSENTGYSKLIFDKFSPVRKSIRDARDQLFSDSEIRSFNSPYLFELFFDKFKTYKKLTKFCIPAVIVKSDKKTSIVKDIARLNKMQNIHTNNRDFSDELILKDRYGAGGRAVYKFNKNNLTGISNVIRKSNKNYILQPLIKFDKGFKYRDIYSSTDIRFIYLSGKIIQTYIRIAKTGDFRCNEHKGGKLIYISKNKIPKRILELSEKIAAVLGNINSLYSLDFIVSNNGNVYLLEGNTGPGLDWEISNKVNEFYAKKLIRTIVKQLALRAKKRKIIHLAKAVKESNLTSEHQTTSTPVFA